MPASSDALQPLEELASLGLLTDQNVAVAYDYDESRLQAAQDAVTAALNLAPVDDDEVVVEAQARLDDLSKKADTARRALKKAETAHDRAYDAFSETRERLGRRKRDGRWEYRNAADAATVAQADTAMTRVWGDVLKARTALEGVQKKQRAARRELAAARSRVSEDAASRQQRWQWRQDVLFDAQRLTRLRALRARASELDVRDGLATPDVTT